MEIEFHNTFNEYLLFGHVNSKDDKIHVFLPNIYDEAQFLVDEGVFDNVEDAVITLLTATVVHETLHLLVEKITGLPWSLQEEAVVHAIELLSVFPTVVRRKYVSKYFKLFITNYLLTLKESGVKDDKVIVKHKIFLEKLKNFIESEGR